MQMSLDGNYLNEAIELERKWSSWDMLEGIKNKRDRQTTSVLLENQLLINEQATDTSDISQFKRISIPLVRRIYPHLIANKIVSVQPLLGPTGLVYYLRFRYSSNKGATRGATQPGFPGDDNLSLQQLASGDANLDKWYAHQFVSAENHVNAGAVNVGGSLISSYVLEKTPVMAGTLVGQIFDGGTLIYNFVVAADGTFTFNAVGSPSPTVSAGSLNLVTGAVNFTWSANPGANNVVFNYEYNMEGQGDLPEVNLAIENESITAITRKLKAVWTYEAQQDIRSQHNLDLEMEITSVLAQEINLEIDREILGDLHNNAGTVAAWDFQTAMGQTIKEKYESLYIKMIELSNVIHRKTLRGGANWIVCSPEVASIFEAATAGFGPTQSDTFTSGLGVQYVGSVSNKWKLYKDPLMSPGQILCGYKGESPMDTGYYFCPYVPLTMTPLVLDPDGFTPRRGIITRYGKILLRDGAKFFGRMQIANFVI